MRLLRRMKSEAALLIALCDIGGVWPVMQVTAALTELAVRLGAIGAALSAAAGNRARAVSPPNPDRPEENSGLIVLAMGKMGAGELNYSSDIDLIVFFDSGAPTLAPRYRAAAVLRARHAGACRGCCSSAPATAMCSASICGCGRIRPRRQVAISTEAALHYYEREGRTWERAAMIKARPCAGDAKAGEAMVAEIAPFVWRKHLDFAALADVHDMKRQMQTYRGQSEIAVEGHNVKIGRGGIREIEFFAQTQQLIAGGRHPELRVRPTLQALDVLASSNWITFEARDELTAAYLFLRRVEHRLQMIADEQTHALPDERRSGGALCPLSSAMTAAPLSPGSAWPSQHRAGALRQAVRRRPGRQRKTAGRSITAPVRDDPRLLEHLTALGFKKPVGGGADRAAMDGRRLSRVPAARRRAAHSSNSFPL